MPTQIEKMVEVMQAAQEGQRIECRLKDSGEEWCELQDLAWNWGTCDYRVKAGEAHIFMIQISHAPRDFIHGFWRSRNGAEEYIKAHRLRRAEVVEFVQVPEGD